MEDVPNRIYHVQGSQAGASSATFHNYRHARRREQERLELVEKNAIEAEKNQEREVGSMTSAKSST